MFDNFFIKTYGCQLNEADSEKMAGLLADIGFEKTENISDANLILLNTCCIRNTAEQKVYGKIGDLKSLKEKNKNLLLGICGCVASKEKDNLITRFPWIDFVVDTFSIDKLPEIVQKSRGAQRHTGTKAQSSKGTEAQKHRSRSLRVQELTTSKIKANVIAVNGCNYACSFCIVPKVRGKEKSRELEEIVDEVKNLANCGVVEITLVGQNVVVYGRDLGKKNYFVNLLQEIHKIDEIKRIRFVTSHPRDFTNEIIEGISKLSKVCNYFHLPIQAGDDEILKKMARGYTVEYYKKRIEKLRNIFPDCAISTDIIVGFPQETEEQFEKTLKLVEEMEFDNAYTFMYSVRSETRAEKVEGQIPLIIKKERLHRLQQIQNEITFEKNKELVGKILEVLVEGYDKKNKSKLIGRTTTNKVVLFEGESNLIGKIVNVKIEGARNFTLQGRAS